VRRFGPRTIRERFPAADFPVRKLEALFAIVRGWMLFLCSLDLSALFRFMASYDAARRGTEQSVMHHVMTSDASYDSALETALRVGRRGDCSSVRVAARIVGGRVYSEDQNYQSNGAVGANGVIRVTVAGAGRSASGSGRLSHNSGAGRWWSSGGECSGNWSASRRAGYY
jgi:hypothetical protein